MILYLLLCLNVYSLFDYAIFRFQVNEYKNIFGEVKAKVGKMSLNSLKPKVNEEDLQFLQDLELLKAITEKVLWFVLNIDYFSCFNHLLLLIYRYLMQKWDKRYITLNVYEKKTFRPVLINNHLIFRYRPVQLFPTTKSISFISHSHRCTHYLIFTEMNRQKPKKLKSY